MLQKKRVLAITKCDLLDEELVSMLKEELKGLCTTLFISAVTGYGIDELKDVLWRELNSESNKIQGVISEEIMVHRDKQQRELEEMEELIPMEDIEDLQELDDIEEIEELEDYEYVDV
jgi:GTP-binding protein